MNAQVMELKPGGIGRVDLRCGDTLALADEGRTVISAFEPSLLELYRDDATSLRSAIERHAKRQRRAAMRAIGHRLFRLVMAIASTARGGR